MSHQENHPNGTPETEESWLRKAAQAPEESKRAAERLNPLPPPSVTADLGAQDTSPDLSSKTAAPGLLAPPKERYQIEKEFARGGLGRILRAKDKKLDRAVAVKELFSSSHQAKERFLREVLITAKLEHPSIVPIHDLDVRPNGEPYYAMKLVDGRSLDKVIATKKTLEERLTLLSNAIDACKAIAYAHNKNIIHRDLKPHNILVGEFGETIVIDWGLAKELGNRELPEKTEGQSSLAIPHSPLPVPPHSPYREEQRDVLTSAGAVLGTPAYMPPEQAKGESVEKRADVYSLGAILYHVLSGKPPYQSRNAKETLQQVLTQSPPPLDPKVPKDLISIVQKAMARDPRDRYPSAQGLLDDLLKFQQGKIVGSHTYSTRELLQRFYQKHQGAVLVGALAFVALLVTGAVSFALILQANHEKEEQRKAAIEGERLAKEGKLLAQTAQDAAEKSANESKERAEKLAIAQARNALKSGDTNQALRWLRLLSRDSKHWREARLVAAEAESLGLPKLIPNQKRLLDLVGSSLLVTIENNSLKVWDYQGVERPLPEGLASLDITQSGSFIIHYNPQKKALFHWNWKEEQLLASLEDAPKDYRISPDEKSLFLLQSDGTPVVFDLFTKEKKPLPGSITGGLKTIDGPLTIVFSQDSRFVLLVEEQHDKHLVHRFSLLENQHQILTETALEQKEDYSSRVIMKTAQFTVTQTKDLLVEAEGLLQRWDISTGTAKTLYQSKDHLGIRDASPEGDLLLAAAPPGEGSLQRLLLVTHTGEVRTLLQPTEQYIEGAALSPDQAYVAFSMDGVLFSLRLATQEIQKLGPYGGRLLRFSPDGSRIISDTQSESWLIDFQNESLPRRLPGHWGVRFSPDGETMFTTSEAGLHLWRFPLEEPSEIEISSTDTDVFAASPDGRFLFYPNEGALVRHDLKTGRQEHVLSGLWITKLYASPDGIHMIALARTSPTEPLDLYLLQREGESWKPRGLQVQATETLRGLSFSSDGATFAALAQSGSILVWKLGETTPTIVQGPPRYGKIYLRDAQTLFMFHYDTGRLSQIDLSTGAEKVLYQKESAAPQWLESSPDLRYFLFSYHLYQGNERVEEIALVDTATTESRVLLSAPNPMGMSMATLSKDASLLSFFDFTTGELGLWEMSGAVASAKKLRTLAKLPGTLFYALKLSDDNQTLLTYDANPVPFGITRLWDLESGQSRLLTPGNKGPYAARTVSFSFFAKDTMLVAGVSRINADNEPPRSKLMLWKDTLPKQQDAFFTWLEQMAPTPASLEEPLP